MSGAAWAPANDAERRLWDAVRAGDPDEVMRILAITALVLPGFPDDVGNVGNAGDVGDAGDVSDAGDAGPRQRLLTRDRDGVPYLLAFTSVEAMRRAVGAEGWRATTLVELVRSWPDLAAQVPWGLAVNPATPIGVLVAPADVATLVPTPAALAPFVPANDVERVLRDGLAAPDGQVLLDVLVTARVVVPTRGLVVDGVPTVAVFTSAQRCEDYLRTAGVGAATVEVDLIAVLRRWPGAGHRLAVNPGSLISFAFRDEQVPDLLAHAVGLLRRRLGDPVAPPGGADPPSSSNPPTPPGPAPDGIADLLRGRG